MVLNCRNRSGGRSSTSFSGHRLVMSFTELSGEHDILSLPDRQDRNYGDMIPCPEIQKLQIPPERLRAGRSLLADYGRRLNFNLGTAYHVTVIPCLGVACCRGGAEESRSARSTRSRANWGIDIPSP